MVARKCGPALQEECLSRISTVRPKAGVKVGARRGTWDGGWGNLFLLFSFLSFFVLSILFFNVSEACARARTHAHGERSRC